MNSIYLVLILVVVYVLYTTLMNKGIKQITTTELKDLMATKSPDQVFIDVRTAGEYKSRKIKGFKNIPLDKISANNHALSKDKTLVLICQSGSRSSAAARKLIKAGHKDIINVRGGMNAWR